LNFSKNYEWFEKPNQKLETEFHQVSLQTPQSWLRKLVCALFFSNKNSPEQGVLAVGVIDRL